jgi:hypothetical protein
MDSVDSAYVAYFVEHIRRGYGERVVELFTQALASAPAGSDPDLSAILDLALDEAGRQAGEADAEFGATRCNS